MADRILKPDSGNDLVLQNDDASAKIEINEAGTIVGTPSIQVDNIKIDGNTISSTDTNGNITLDPNGTGLVNINSATGLSLAVDNLRLDGNAITSTDTNGHIDLTPNGTGEVNISKVDIDAGTIDGTTIATSDITVGSGKTLNVSSGTLTTSTAQKTAIIAGGDFPSGSVVGVGHSGRVETVTDFSTTSYALNNYTSFEYTLKTSNPYITIISNIMVYLSVTSNTIGSGHFVVSMKNKTGGTTSHQEMEDFDANMHRFYETAAGTHQMHQVMSGTTRKQLSSVLDGSGVTTAGTVIEIGIGVYRTGTLSALTVNEGVTNGSGTNFLLLEEKS